MDRNQGLMDRVFTMEGLHAADPATHFPAGQQPDNYFDLLNINYFLYTDSARGTIGLRERPGYLQRAYLVFTTVIARNEEDVRARMTEPAFDPRAVAVVEDSTVHADLAAVRRTRMGRAGQRHTEATGSPSPSRPAATASWS